MGVGGATHRSAAALPPCRLTARSGARVTENGQEQVHLCCDPRPQKYRPWVERQRDKLPEHSWWRRQFDTLFLPLYPPTEFNGPEAGPRPHAEARGRQSRRRAHEGGPGGGTSHFRERRRAGRERTVRGRRPCRARSQSPPAFCWPAAPSSRTPPRSEETAGACGSRLLCSVSRSRWWPLGHELSRRRRPSRFPPPDRQQNHCALRASGARGAHQAGRRTPARVRL